MTKIQNINPETAAHNIATIFSKKYIDSQKDTSILSVDSTKLYDVVKYASNLYAFAYDEAYEFFSTENEKDKD